VRESVRIGERDTWLVENAWRAALSEASLKQRHAQTGVRMYMCERESVCVYVCERVCV
jgi:hypothetical protein